MATMPPQAEPKLREEDLLAKTMTPPEHEVQRGRKRRRSPPPLSFVASGAAQQTPSGESATLRGRCRLRSTSLANLPSRNPSRGFRSGSSTSPSHKRLLHRAVSHLERRFRSQSPSRSHSPTALTIGARRRRQRTRSRSRSHYAKDVSSFPSYELKPPPPHFDFVADNHQGPVDKEEG